MCGICAYIGPDAVHHIVSELKILEIRGYDSAGIAWWDGSIRILKGVGYVEHIFAVKLPEALMAVGHVRWATHGKVSHNNAHPHTDCSGSIVVCHNGVIENIEDLKQQLAKHHHFQSETDTEVIAHLLEGSDLTSRIPKVADMLEGHNSFAVLSDGRLYASCGGPPLLIAPGELASDASALRSIEFLSLKKGDVVEIEENGWSFLRGTPDITYRYFVKKDADGVQDGHSTSFMREIWQQPEAMMAALNNEPARLLRVCHQMGKNVILTGAGSSKVACMWAKYKFMEVGVDAEVIPVGDWLSRPIPQAQTIIAVSQSGETGTLVSLVDALKDTEKQLIAIVNTPWSYLARQSNEVFELFCGPEKSVIASKSFIGECVVLGYIAAYKGNIASAFEHIVARASIALKKWLPSLQVEIDKLDIVFERCFVCGEGTFYPVAHEGAMKLKEGAYIFAEPMVSSEFKHEAMPLMTAGEVVFWVGETTGGGVAEIAQIRAREATVIGISVKDLGFSIHIPMPEEAIDFPPLAVVPFQLLTQRIALKRGINVDRPRNLAKVITVK